MLLLFCGQCFDMEHALHEFNNLLLCFVLNFDNKMKRIVLCFDVTELCPLDFVDLYDGHLWTMMQMLYYCIGMGGCENV